MVIGVEQEGIGGQQFEQRAEQFDDAQLDGFGIGAAEAKLEFGAAQFLVRGHGALAAQGAVGEVIDHPAVGADGEVGMEGEELGAGEGLEAVDDEGFAQGGVLEVGVLKEAAVLSEAGGEAGDGGMRGSQDAADLAQARSLGEPGGDGDEEVPEAQAAGGGEGAVGEVTAAVAAAEGAEAVLVGGADEGAAGSEAPVGVRAVEGAAGVGAMGWLEATLAVTGL